jgi:hypothetical protein
MVVDSLSLEQLYAEYEREEQFVLFEQRATHVAVNGVGKVIVERLDASVELSELLAVHNRAVVEIDEPVERVLVHRVDVCQIADAKEEGGRVLGHRQVAHTRQLDLFLRLFGDLLLGRDLFGEHLRTKPRGSCPRCCSAASCSQPTR